MTPDEPRALAMEALISELYGALSMAKLTADVGPCSSMADVQIYTARGSMPWALKGLAMQSAPGASREFMRPHDGAPYCEACGHEALRAPAPPPWSTA